MIVFRKRIYEDVKYNEYLLLCDQSSILSLPKELPKRYQDRIIERQKNVYCVNSISFAEIRQIKSTDLSISNGVWVTRSDCLQRGGECENQIALRTFFSFRIDDQSAEKILSFESVNIPLALYHGTSFENKDLILKEGLKYTNGMLGQGIYFGTFWKAARFAYLSQNYVKRKGIVFRVLIFPKHIRTYPEENWICTCEKCVENPYCALIADHESKWRDNYDCASAKPTLAAGIKKDGTKKYLLKNEEWIYNEKRKLIITDVAEIDFTSIKGENYDPDYRGIKIL